MRSFKVRCIREVVGIILKVPRSCVVATILFFLASSSALGQLAIGPVAEHRAAQSLQLSLESEKSVYRLSEPIHLKLVVKNVSRSDVRLFQPSSQYLDYGEEWGLRCRFKKPNGQDVCLEPGHFLSFLPEPKKEDFIILAPGERISFNMDLESFPDEDAPSNMWVTVIDSWSEWEDVLKGNEFYVRKIKGVKGRYSFTLGGNVTLLAHDLIKDVFNEAGNFSLACDYHNHINYYWVPKENGYMGVTEFPEIWTGSLRSQPINIEVKK